MLKNYLGILNNPKENGKEAVAQGKVSRSLIYILIQAILSGIFTCIILVKLNGVIKQSIDSAYNTVVEGVPGFIKRILDLINLEEVVNKFEKDSLFSLGGGFLFGFLGSILITLLIVLITRLIIRIFWWKSSFKKVFNVCGVRAVGKSIFTLLAVIIMIFNLVIGFIVFLLGGLFGYILSCDVIEAACEGKLKKITYAKLIAVILTFIISFGISAAGTAVYTVKYIKAESEALNDLIDDTWGNITDVFKFLK